MRGYVFIFGVFAVIILSLITLNIFFQRTLQMEMAEQFNRQQQLLANAEAANIQAYISAIKDEVLHITQFLAMYHIVKEADLTLLTDVVFKDIGNVGKRMEFLDSQKKVVFARGDLKTDDPADRNSVIVSKGLCEGDVHISQDTKRVNVSAPVCNPGSQINEVSVSIDIQDLAKAFLGPIKSGLRGYAWMMDERGNLLYHPTQPDMVGRNLYLNDSSCFRCHKSFDVEKKIIEGKGDHYGRHVAPTGEDKILAFSTSSVGDSRWIVAVSAPYSEVTMPIRRSMKFYVWIIILIFAATSGVSAMLIIQYRKREQAEERAKHEEELERYAADLEQKVDLRTKELSVEKEKLNTIVSTVGSGILMIDTQGKILWINQTMKDLARGDITGMFCEEICSDCNVVSSYEENDMQTEILSNLFGRSDRYFQVTSAPVRGQDGSVNAYIRLVQDVTEMKKAEEQMMHTEKLASLERLTAGIASEISNPLTSVFSFVQVLMDMEEDELKRETLETIDFHMKRISDILKQLSGFSKMPPMELRPWKVNNIITDAISLIQYDKRAQDITIVRDLSRGIPEITTDRNKLSQVIVNILLHSADAMPNGGTLTIRSGLKDNKVVIVFEDTGAGIDKGDLDSIFDPFYAAKEKNAGIGLAVSYNIVKKLNGSLTAESELDRGSKFVITLPVS